MRGGQVNHKHELKTPFKSQTDLLEYVKEMAKDTMNVFMLVGLHSGGMYERWEELATTPTVDMLGERTAKLEAAEEELVDRVDELRSAAMEVASDCDRLNDAMEGLARSLTRRRSHSGG